MDGENFYYKGGFAMKRLGIIGAGAIGSAIVGGLISTKTFAPEDIIVTNREKRKRLLGLKEAWRVNITEDKKELLKFSDTIIIAVKPQDIDELLQEVKRMITKKHLIISVVAGLKTSVIESKIGKKVRVIRTMPNIAVAVGESATAIAKGAYATDEDIESAKRIFCSLGRSVVINESLMDLVTALSGSGPAYIYFLIEAMREGAIKSGMPEDVAHVLALQTLWGASELSKRSNEDISLLRERITSPGGTTASALQTMKEHGLPEIISKAIESATTRSKELNHGT